MDSLNAEKVFVEKGELLDALYYADAITMKGVKIINQFPAADVAPVRRGTWEWFEEWIPSTTEHPAECEDCGWQCGNCKRALEDMVGGYWDDPYERPQLAYCPNCGCRMDGGN